MTYNFDEVIERRGTDSVKWDGVKSVWGRDDLLPMWVADMDFRTPPFVMEALRKRLEHEVLGYTSACEEWYTSICSWLSRRHGWDVTREMLTFVPGIVRGQAFALQCFTNPGDRVMVMTPVYHPFFLVTQRMKREVVYSPLDLKDGQYQIDFERFRKDIQGCKVLILCNPHNPVGRVWSEEELRRVGEICLRHGVLVVSDEIHSDFTYGENIHHVFASLDEKYAAITTTCTAPSKTFNIAGLQISNIWISNPELRARFRAEVTAAGYSQVNLMGLVACQAAYETGEEWLKELKIYLEGNLDYVRTFLKENLPEIKLTEPEGTYLLWLDFKSLGMKEEQLKDLVENKAKLWLDSGAMFGPDGEGFERINIACPREILKQALTQLAEAVHDR